MNPVFCYDSDGVIKNQQIANLSIKNGDRTPIMACWIKGKTMLTCVIYSMDDDGSGGVGT